MKNSSYQIHGSATLDISQVNSSLGKIQQNLSKIQLKPELKNSFTKVFSDIQSEVAKFQQQIDKGFKTKGDVSGLESTARKIDSLFTQLGRNISEVQKMDFSKVIKFDSNTTKQLSTIDIQIKQLQKDLQSISAEHIDTVTSSLAKLQNEGAKKGGTRILEAFKAGDFRQAKQELDNLIASQQKWIAQTQSAGKNTSRLESNLSILTNLVPVFEQATRASEGLENNINQLDASKINILESAVSNLAKGFDESSDAVSETQQVVRETSQEVASFANNQQRLNSELDQVKNNITHFFSLANSIQLLQKTIRSAFETVKELDKAMTETAVVTDFSVGDMWEELPRYTAAANELGTTTLGAYETMTLFYQQGLKTNEVFEIGTETMKMARIAGMDYVQATDLMTAALRGFNMELSNDSALKVNDVYSELAAITASDTEEIATAMTKTASIANSANMEFETTAAFLAQMIETTRESAENLGTAMKTIVARFTEMKKAPTGIVEVEGEEVNVNKVDEALKSVGVSLKDVNGEFRDLDDVFLELASKWNTLDIMQQRYVATTAAGSRQQSRFIAMMSNYERTMELVNAANNSAGASQRQFEKTTESLESKLNRLSNEWNEFTMGIANNSMIKGAVDILTSILETINKITESLGPTAGGILKLGLAFASIKIGKSVFDKVFNAIGSSFLAGGQKAGKEFDSGLKQNLEKASLSTRAWGKKINNELKKNIQIDGNTFGSIAKTFSKVPQEIQQQIRSSMPTLGKDLVNDFKSAINYDSLNVVGKELADRLEAGFIQDLQDGDIETAINNLTSRLKKPDMKLNWSDMGGKNISGDITATAKTVNNLSQSMTDLGNRVGAVGSLFNNFASVLDGLGLTGLANTVRTIGMAFTGLAGILTSVTAIFPMMGTSAVASGTAAQAAWAPFLPILYAIAAVVTIVAIAFGALSAIQANSLEGQLKSAKEEAEAAKKAAEEAKTAYDDLLSGLDSYNTARDNLDTFVEGTLEWRDALAEVNAQVLELLQTYPELAAYVERTASGELVISDEGQEFTKGNKEKATKNATTSQLSAEIKVMERNQAVTQEDLAKQADNIDRFFGTGLSLDDWLNKYKEDSSLFVSPEISKNEFKSMSENEQKKLMQQYQINPDTYGFDVAYDSMIDLFDTNKIYAFSDSLLDVVDGNAFAAENLREFGTDIAKYNNDLTTGEISKKGLFDTLLNNNLDIEELDIDGKLTNTFLDAFSALNFDSFSTDLEEKTSEFSAKSKEELQQLYADALDIDIDDISDDIKDDKDKLAAALASMSLGDEYAENMKNILSKVNSTNQEAASNFFSLLAKDASSASEEDLKNIKDNGAPSYIQDIIEDFGFVTESGVADLAAFEKAFGISVKDLVSYLEESADVIEKKQAELKTNLYKTMMTSGGISNSQDMITLMNTMNQQQREFMDTSLTNIEPSLGKEGQAVMLQEIARNPSLMADTESYKELQSLVSGIDWSNPIDMASQLNSALSSTDQGIRNLANGLLKVGQESLSSGAQLKYFMESADFTEIDEELQNFIDENGKISPSNIQELAKSSASLNKILGQGKVNASALAKALTGIKLGTIDSSGLTTRVLEALSSVKTLDEYLEKMHDTIQNFDAGIDSGEGIDFLSSASEKMNEYAEGYEFGNTQFQNYFAQVFGGEALQQALASANPEEIIRNRLSQLESWVEGDGYGFWSQVANKSINIEGVKSYFDENGDVIVEAGKKTSEEMIKAIAEAANVSEDTANMMLQNFRSHSLDLAKELGQNDFSKAMEELLSPKYNVGGDNKMWVLSEEEIRTWAQVTGQTVEEVTAQVKAKAAELNGSVKIANWFDDSGALVKPEEALAKISDLLDNENWVENFIVDVEVDGVETAALDVDALKEKLTQLGVPEDLHEDLIESIGADREIPLTASVEIPETGADGITRMVEKSVTGADMSAVTKEIDARIEAADYDLVAEKITSQDLSGLQNSTTKAIADGAAAGAAAAQKSVDGITVPTKTMYIDAQLLPGSSINVPVSLNVPKNAKGTGPSGFKKDGASMVGEEGYEVVQDENGAYLVGVNGPEIVPLNKGDIVYPHNESKKMVSNQFHQKIPRYATGKWGSKDKNAVWNSGSSSSGGGNQSVASDVGEEVEEWENTYDWLYNLTEDINEELRTREKLERRYNRILIDRTKTGKDLLANVNAQLDSLKQQQKLEQEMYEKRTLEMQRTLDDNKELAKYATFNWKDNTIEINWDLIDSVTDKDTGEAIEKYISKLEDIQDEMDNAEDALDDIIDEIQELKDLGKDEFFDLENRIMDALVGKYQEQIDELSAINDSMDEANSKLIDSIQKNLSKLRQDRENEKTEEDLAAKERRLAYLRQDTSGGNALEIKKLEEELANAQEDYTDSLIDQKISELQDQNDKASQQRQKQVELAQAQLEWAQKTGELWSQVQTLVKDGVDKTGKLVEKSDLAALLKSQEGFEGLSNLQKMNWMSELEQDMKVAVMYYNKMLNEHYGTSYNPKNDYMADIDAAIRKGDLHAAAVAEQKRNAKIVNENLDYELTYNYVDYLDKYQGNVDYMAEIDKALKNNDYLSAAIAELQRNKKIDDLGLDYEKTYDYIKYLFIKGRNPLLDYTRASNVQTYSSMPGAVSSNVSRGFDGVTDIARTFTSDNLTQNSGDNYYEIHIEVDSLGSDYDVDKLTDKIKRSIQSDAQYRNVNAISHLK